MPGYSGLEVCQRIKEAQETSRIPILLTVGKLEPFKPEEAKRVRADAFIVKPFEASELLSALAKLEDKIVPAGRETSKPGRFARANAAIEEGRYDKTMAIEEDSGWKNRIAFPSRKKKSEEKEDGDDPAIYNALNKDLRTVVEHPPAPGATHEDRVNLGALAPEGLPKDVTPEEIAALAAAAAHITGSVAENKETHPAPQPTDVASTVAPVNQADIETIDLNLAAIRKAEAALAGRQTQPAPVAEPLQAEVAKEPESVTASIAEVREPKQEADKPAEVSVAPQELASSPVPQGAELMAAMTSVEPQNIATASSGNGLGSHDAADAPITMAVAAGAEQALIPSRWTAVSVPLASEEAAISLEHEMQKAQAAFATAETHAAAVVSEPEPQVAQPPAVPGPGTEKAISDSEPSLAAIVVPEVSEAATAVASLSTDVIKAAVKELEAVAASYEGHRPFSSETASPSSETEPGAASSKEAGPQPPIPTPADQAEPVQSEPEAVSDSHPQAPVAEATTEEPAATVQEVSSIDQPMPASLDHPQAAAPESSTETPVPSHHTEPVAPGESSAGGTTEVSKKESEISESTAAAWASWRRIRESGDHKSAPFTSADDNDHSDAAMAVAVGAEKAPDDASPNQDSGEIASIVDSVLADLRPKIVEEISRKLGKKK